MAIYAYVSKSGENQWMVRRAPGLVTPAVVSQTAPDTGFIGFAPNVSEGQRLAERATFGGRSLSWIQDNLPGNIESWRGERNP